MSEKLSKAQKRHLANLARQADHLRQIGVDAAVVDIAGSPAVVLASAPGQIVSSDRALRIVLAKMKAKPHGASPPTLRSCSHRVSCWL